MSQSPFNRVSASYEMKDYKLWTFHEHTSQSPFNRVSASYMGGLEYPAHFLYLVAIPFQSGLCFLQDGRKNKVKR